MPAALCYLNLYFEGTPFARAILLVFFWVFHGVHCIIYGELSPRPFVKVRSFLIALATKDSIPGNVLAIRPLKDGVIADFDIAEGHDQVFHSQSPSAFDAQSSYCSVCVPSGATPVERMASHDAAFSAGASEFFIGCYFHRNFQNYKFSLKESKIFM